MVHTCWHTRRRRGTGAYGATVVITLPWLAASDRTLLSSTPRGCASPPHLPFSLSLARSLSECTHAHTHTRTHANTHTHTRTHTHTHTHTHTQKRTHAHTPSPTLSPTDPVPRAPTDPVGQSWPRGTESVGDSVGEGYYSVIHIAVLLQCETPSSANRDAHHELSQDRSNQLSPGRSNELSPGRSNWQSQGLIKLRMAHWGLLTSL